MNTAEFWYLYGFGLVGVVLWLLGTRLDPRDPRVDGSPLEALKANWVGLAFACTAHLISSVALWEGVEVLSVPPVRNVLFYIASGALSQTFVVKVLSIIAGKFKADK